MGRTAPSHGPGSGQTWGSRRRCRARARTESHLAATTDVGPQARETLPPRTGSSSQCSATPGKVEQRPLRRCLWKLPGCCQCWKWKGFLLTLSVVNCFVNFAERKQEESRDWRRKKSGLEGRGRVTRPVPSGNHHPKLALSDPLSCCPRGLGVSAPSGKPSTHSVRSAPHCAPPSPTPCPLP